MTSKPAVLILIDGDDNQVQWHDKFKSKTLLEHAIERSQVIGGPITIAVKDLEEKDRITSELNSELTQKCNFMVQDTSITNFSGNLKSLITALKNMQDINYLIVHSISYSLLNSLDLLRLLHLLQEKPLELVTFKTPSGFLTTEVLGINLKLTKTRLDEVLKFKDTRFSFFYRSSLNTGVIPIQNENHRLKTFDQVGASQTESDDYELNLGELIIVRPAKHYRAFQKLHSKEFIEKQQLLALLSEERQKWGNIEPIIEHNRSDEQNF